MQGWLRGFLTGASPPQLHSRSARQTSRERGLESWQPAGRGWIASLRFSHEMEWLQAGCYESVMERASSPSICDLSKSRTLEELVASYSAVPPKSDEPPMTSS